MIVSVPELQAYMNSIGLDADQAESAEDILRGLQRELERYCQRPIERKVRTEVVRPDELGRLWPKATPIWSVSSPAGLLPNGANGIEGSYGLSLMPFGTPGPVTITYVGGLVDPALVVQDEDGAILTPEEEDATAEVADIKIAILRAAAREVTVRHDDTLSVKDLGARDVQPVDRREPGFTDAELAKFDRIRRRTVV